MSRPKKEVTRSEVVRFKMTKDEKDRLLKEAKKRDLSVSEFVRVCIINEIDMTTFDYLGGNYV